MKASVLHRPEVRWAAVSLTALLGMTACTSANNSNNTPPSVHEAAQVRITDLGSDNISVSKGKLVIDAAATYNDGTSNEFSLIAACEDDGNAGNPDPRTHRDLVVAEDGTPTYFVSTDNPTCTKNHVPEEVDAGMAMNVFRTGFNA